MVPPEEWSGLSLRLILHGRRVCTARNPRHDICVLRDICPSADGELPRPRAARAKPRAKRPPKEPTAAQ
jgi:endonuclease-3